MSIDVLFIAGFGPIDHDIDQSRALYGEGLGISFKGDADGYLYTGALEGASRVHRDSGGARGDVGERQIDRRAGMDLRMSPLRRGRQRT